MRNIISTPLLSTGAAIVMAAGAAQADVPQVAADILPVHSLVARVMEGVGAPGLIIRPGADPHAYSMRPSEAALLEGADLVFWVGEGLTPWLEGPLGTLAANAEIIELPEVEGTSEFAWRESEVFGAVSDDHADEHGHEDEA